MGSTTLRIILYSLVAATSPLALGATLAVLKSTAARVNGFAFAVAFVVAQTIVCLLCFAFDAASLSAADDNQHRLGTLFALAFGVALLGAAAYLHRHPRHHETRPAGPRTQAVLARLQALTPGAALGTGALLGFGGPKRLGVTIVVAATISSAALPVDEEFALVALYVALATVLVWLPVVLYIVFGRRANHWMDEAQQWVYAHEQPLTFYPTLVLGIVLVVEALTNLL